MIGSRNLEYPWIFTVLLTERKMVRRFTKVSEEEIEEAFFYPSDLVNTKTTTPPPPSDLVNTKTTTPPQGG